MIAFWEDKWREERPLKEIFPDVYFLAENRLAKAADYMDLISSFVV